MAWILSKCAKRCRPSYLQGPNLLRKAEKQKAGILSRPIILVVQARLGLVGSLLFLDDRDRFFFRFAI